MIEYCCLAVLLVILIFILLAIIPRRKSYENTHYSQKNNKVNGKICIKCGNVSNIDSKFCKHCGNEF